MKRALNNKSRRPGEEGYAIILVMLITTIAALLMYRHALLLNGGLEASSTQCETMLTMALESCERYFPALQFVIWAGRGSQEAMEAALFEASGEA